MAYKFVTLAAVTIDTAGAREQITATSTHAACVIVTADSDNTGKIYVGDSTVSSSNGIELAAGESVSINGADVRGSTDDIILSDIYIDTATNGNVARVCYLTRR